MSLNKYLFFSIFVFISLFSITTFVFANAPFCSVMANPNHILSGNSSIITWTSTDTDSCNSGGHGTGISGSFSVAPISTNTYHISCTKNAQNIPGSCSGNYSAIVGSCSGTVMGSTDGNGTGPYEGESCVGMTQSLCTSGWLTHGCHWTNVNTNFSCSSLNENGCDAHPSCSWNSGYPLPSQVSTCSATVTVLPNNNLNPIGNISATSCQIPDGASTCTSILNWSTLNLVSGVPFEVTRNNPNNTHISSIPFGNNVNNTINYGSSTYYLYYNGVVLNSKSVSASCNSGSAWNGIKCLKQTDQNSNSNISSPQGNISATSCQIPDGASTCTSILNWSTLNLVSGVPFEVTRNNPNYTHISSIPFGNNVNNIINYGSSTYYLYYNGTILNSTSINPTCILGTVWNGEKCITSTILNGSGDCSSCSTNNPKNPHYQEN